MPRRRHHVGGAVVSTEATDLGPGELYPFCPCEPGRKPKSIVIWFARDGAPDRIVESRERSARQGRAVRAHAVDPLDWYHSRKPDLIPAALYAAGKRLRSRYEFLAVAGLSAVDLGRERISQSRSGGGNLPDRVLQYAKEVKFALDFVGGPELDRILLSVVCEGDSMEAFERRHGWRSGGGQVALRTALYRLALVYGLIGERRGRIAWWKPE